MSQTNLSNNVRYSVWVRKGLTGTAFILTDLVGPAEADVALAQVRLEPGDGAGILAVLPGESAVPW